MCSIVKIVVNLINMPNRTLYFKFINIELSYIMIKIMGNKMMEKLQFNRSFNG